MINLIINNTIAISLKTDTELLRIFFFFFFYKFVNKKDPMCGSNRSV